MQNQHTPTFEQEHSENEIQIRDIFDSVLRNWYWVVISIITCVMGAFFYTKTVTQIYQAEALILIKTENKGGMSSSETAIFQDLGLGTSSAIIENEIPVLRSTALMTAVVQELGLDITYTVKPLLRTVDIYGRSPIELVFPNKELMNGVTIDITPLSQERFQYGIYDEQNKITLSEASFGDTLSVVEGAFIVQKTPLFGSKSAYETIKVTISDVREKAKSILNELTVRRTDKVAGILSLTLNDNNFQRSIDILNKLIEVYNNDIINDKNRVATNTENFIVERIANISLDLGNIDGQIEDLKKKNNITDFASTSALLIQTGSKYKEEVVSIETEISMVQFIREYLSDPTKKNELIPTNIGISDTGIESQIAQYNAERLRLDKLSAQSGANNPVTIELINTLNVTKANMIRSIDNLLSSLQIKRGQIIAQENLANRRIVSVPTQEKEVNDVVRQQKIKEELYLYLLNKREENALNLAITESNAKTIEKGDGRDIPISPKISIILLFSFMMGFALPVIIIFVIYWLRSLDNKIHTKRDIENGTSIPIIGELPRKHKNSANKEIMISDTGRDRISEAFRIVRSNLDFIAKKESNGARVIQLTSTIPGEGKSYVTINLALSYAHTGKKVLVMDLDLRKGRMSKIADKKGINGISEYLSGKTDDIFSLVNKEVTHKNLDVIATGPIPPNPANLLMSERFEQAISILREHYDYIFMDTVPFSIVADASIINRIADITIYIIRNGLIDKRYLPELEKLHKEDKVNNICILLTDVNIDNKQYGYRYGYSYSYAYTYEEDNNVPHKKRR